MGFTRTEVDDNGIKRDSRVGDGWNDMPIVGSTVTQAVTTLSTSDLLKGHVMLNGATTAQVASLTTNILSSLATANIGDTHLTALTNLTTAGVCTLATTAGVTLAGFTTVPALTTRDLIVEKTSTTTIKATAI